jgi:Family of unknown function (DUF5343)
MATSHPYISGAGNVTAIITQLRKNFPQTVTSETVKKFGIAPNNESYLVNMLAFLGLIDGEGKRTDKGHDVLATHKEEDFHKAFGELVKKAYSDLFGTFGDPAGWQQDRDALVNYFRKTDKTSDIIGRRQAGTFLALAGLAGHAEPTPEAPKTKPAVPKSKAAGAKPGRKKTEMNVVPSANTSNGTVGSSNLKRDMALTVRIEINLPVGGTRETYDAIFKSIKANLIDE